MCVSGVCPILCNLPFYIIQLKITMLLLYALYIRPSRNPFCLPPEIYTQCITVSSPPSLSLSISMLFLYISL